MLAAATVLLASCGPAAPPPDPVVARYGERTLTATTLAHWLVLGQPLPLETGVGEELARHWLELTALRARLEAGDSLRDDVWRIAMADAIEDSLIAADRASRVPDLAARVAVETDRAASSADRRLIAHVLRRTDASTRIAERELQRLTAERIRARLLAGGTWDEANAENEDDAARANAGLIGLMAPGELPEPLATAAAGLEPGDVSAVVETGFGYHVLHRPRLDGAWRARLAALVRDEIIERIDADRSGQLLRDAALTMVPGVEATVRSIAREPWRSAPRQDTVARWMPDGALTAGDVARRLVFLPVAASRALIAADDQDVAAFVADVAARSLMIREAERRGVTVSADALAAIESSFRSEVDAMIRQLEQHSGAAATGLDPDVRAGLRAASVERQLEAVVSRRATLTPLPPLLTLRLLEDATWTLDVDAIPAALATARRLIEAADASMEMSTR